MIKINKYERKLSTEEILDYHDSKSVLAKIIAGEDLELVHDSNAQTAYINLEERKVCIPLWNNMTPSVYDLFLAHEVSHALHTPLEGYHGNGEYPAGFRSFLNVTEDSRIERLIVKKYPGLRAVFSRAYGSLYAEDFFRLGDKPIAERLFIDRLNLHTKLNSMHDLIKIEFNETEQGFIDRLQTCDTFEEILEITKEIYDYCKKEDEQKRQEEWNDIVGDQDNEDNEDSSMDQDTTNSETETESDSDEDEDEEEEIEDDEEEMEESILRNNNYEITEEEGEEIYSETSESEQDSIRNFSAGDSDINVYSAEYVQEMFDAESPYINHMKLKDYYLNAYENYSNIHSDIRNDSLDWISRSEEALDWLKGSNLKYYNHFLKENNSAINTMVQGFMRKKSASNYYRNTESKTGVLNMSKLHGYKYNDDLFKKVVNNFDGDDYGMVFLLDQSGSMMNDKYHSVLEQLLILVEFCRRVQMPYKVYSFYSGDSFPGKKASSTMKKVGEYAKERELLNKNMLDGSGSGTYIIEWLSSNDKSSEHKKLMNCMIGGLISNTSRYTYRHRWDDSPPSGGVNFYFHGYNKYWLDGNEEDPSYSYYLKLAEFMCLFDFGGTPLNDSLCFLRGQIIDFKRQTNSERVTLVTLTDGSNTGRLDIRRYKVSDEVDEIHSEYPVKTSWEKTTYINLKVDGQTHKIKSQDFHSYGQSVLLKVLYDFEWINCIKIDLVEKDYTSGSFQSGVSRMMNLPRDLTALEKKFRCVIVEDDLLLGNTMYDKNVIVFGIKAKETQVELDTTKKVTKASLGRVLNSMNIESNRKKMLANTYIDTITL